MDWDTCSIDKPKYPPKNLHRGDITSLKARYNIPLFPRDASVISSRSMEESVLRIGDTWKVVSPTEVYSQILDNKSITSELDEIKIKYRESNKLILEHEKILTEVLNENIVMKREIQQLKSHIKIFQETEDIWKSSEENIHKIEKLFSLPPSSNESLEITFTKMKGLFKEYSEDGVSSIDLLAAMRNHD